MRRWTIQDFAVLRSLYTRIPATDIAIELGRSTAAVQQKAASIGLRRTALQKSAVYRIAQGRRTDRMGA